MNADQQQTGHPTGSVRVARWAGTLGVAAPAIGTVIYPVWSFPATQTGGTDIAGWAAINHDRLAATQVLNTVGVALWLIFGAAVWAHLRYRLPAGSPLPAAFGAGLVVFVTLILAGFTAFDLLLYCGHGAETSVLLYDLTFGLLAMSGIPTAVALGAFAGAVYFYRALPRSTGHFASVAAVGHVLLIAAFVVPDGPFALQGFATTAGVPILLFAWILRTALAIPRGSVAAVKPSRIYSVIAIAACVAATLMTSAGSGEANAAGSCPTAPQTGAAPEWTLNGATGSVAVTGSTDTAAPVINVTAPFSVTQTQVQTLRAGDGPVVPATAKVSVCYMGVNGRDGSVFDNSYERGAPVDFPLTGVVPGFQKAIAGQKVGSTVAVAMTSADGYPNGQPSAGIRPGDTLIFAIKVLASS